MAITSSGGYTRIATALKEERDIWMRNSEAVFGIDRAIRTLGDLFRKDNSRFDPERFYEAAGLIPNEESNSNENIKV